MQMGNIFTDEVRLWGQHQVTVASLLDQGKPLVIDAKLESIK